MGDDDEEELGCEYCRNDGRLTDTGHCPKCDAWYPPEESDTYQK